MSREDRGEGRGPLLAVLPFADEGLGQDQAFLAQGLFEDLCGELSRFPTLQVLSWMSGQAAAGLDDRELGRRLGATHVLRGRVRAVGEGLRVSVALVECGSATHQWSERFEGVPENLFDLEEGIVARIAASLVPALEERELAQARRRPPESLAAYELCLRGLTKLRAGNLAADEEARGLFRCALELDPLHARAHGGLSLSYFNEWSCQHWSRFRENGELAYAHAHRALALDDRDALLHLVIGRILLYRREFERASWYLERAQALCPNDAELLIQLAGCEAYLGLPELAVAHAERALRLNPYHPADYQAYASLAYFAARDLERALELAASGAGALFVDSPAYSAVALAHLGRVAEGRERRAAYEEVYRRLIAGGREPEPGASLRWLLEVNPFRRTQDVDFLLEGFRLLEARDPGTPPTAAAPEVGRRGDGEGSAASERALLCPSGSGWVLEYGGRRAVLPDLKGLHDLRRLLERPGEDLHCLDLAGRRAEGFGSDEVLDGEARSAIRARLAELRSDLDEAEEQGDPARAEAARAEIQRLAEALAQALGLGGRGRRLGDAAERARSTVTQRLRLALERCAAAHPRLGRHLANSLSTGHFCSYRPEVPVAWSFEGP